jgi:hypothetical protein
VDAAGIDRALTAAREDFQIAELTREPARGWVVTP